MRRVADILQATQDEYLARRPALSVWEAFRVAGDGRELRDWLLARQLIDDAYRELHGGTLRSLPDGAAVLERAIAMCAADARPEAASCS